MNVSVIGAGYVGLTTAACLAELGHSVFCAESDLQKLAKLNEGKLPFFEPQLEELMANNRAAGRLHFGSTEDAIDHGTAILICVGTPPLENGEADLSYIEAVAGMIARRAQGYRLVIEKSTVPVQTGLQLRKHLAQNRNRNLHYDVASNPEFLREGSAVENFFHPDRIVVGVESERAEAGMRELYGPMLEGKVACPVHADCKGREQITFLVTDTNSAEMIKHASNSFLAMKISYINLIADLCDAAGADVRRVSEGMGLDPRIGPSFLNPGIGFGGFCFPKDLQAFVRIAGKFNCDFSLLEEVEKINLSRVKRFVEKIRRELWVLRGKKIAVWGLSFKPDTDDVRFSPAIALVRALLAEGASVQAHDPAAMEKAQEDLPGILCCVDPYEAARGADAIVLVTEWPQFSNLDWTRLAKLVSGRRVFDGRNALGGENISSFGFEYFGIGGVSHKPAAAIAPTDETASIPAAWHIEKAAAIVARGND